MLLLLPLCACCVAGAGTTYALRAGLLGVKLQVTELTALDDYKDKVVVEWDYTGTGYSMLQMRKDFGAWEDVKYVPERIRRTHFFIYLFHSTFHIRVRTSNQSMVSNEIRLVKPTPPTNLKLVSISLNEDKSKRDLTLSWRNPAGEAGGPRNVLVKNWVKRRERRHDAVDGHTAWENVRDVPARDPASRDVQYVLAGLAPDSCQLTATAQNKVGLSNYSNIVTVDGPRSPPINLTLARISISDPDTGTENRRDFHFTFVNPQHGDVNKLYRVQFESRVATDDSGKSWGPWRNASAVEVAGDAGSDLRDGAVTLPDHATHTHPAIQFRARAEAFVGTSRDYSNVITVPRPAPPPENLTLVDIAPSSRDREDENRRDFRFEVDNHRYDVNKIIRMKYQYRVYTSEDFGSREEWRDVEPVDVDSDRLHASVTLSDLQTSDKWRQFLRLDFRATAVGYVGVSDPSHIVIAEVPGRPRRLNYIYYGSDVECFTRAKCEMELDWWMGRYNGTFEVLDYIVQSKYHAHRDRRSNWSANCTVPESGLHYKRQFISFDYYYEYRVVARNALGHSLPSNVLFTASNRFKAYSLNASYVRPSNDTRVVRLKLYWEQFDGGDIARYIVQSNLFFEHDTRPVRDELTVPPPAHTAEFDKRVTFLKFEEVDGSVAGYFLVELRVTSQRADGSWAATSATTILHFSHAEYAELGDKLCGCMPAGKLIVDQQPASWLGWPGR